MPPYPPYPAASDPDPAPPTSRAQRRQEALYPQPEPDIPDRAWPLRTWLVVIIVLLSGLGLAASSVAVSSIMREVIYSRVDEDLINSLGGWARNSEIFKSDSA
ncbi:MAG TPA: hypothetical protein VJY40_06025, partial [Corynebacterium sp.]|nr:hypothetical protein [Corynebacterium sp.]